MSRRQHGELIVRPGKRGTGYLLRFYAYGERRYVTLNSRDGWTEAKARQELENLIADVRRGIWRPEVPAPAPEPLEDPTFHEFSSQWLADREHELRPNTLLDYRWQLTDHLLPFFADHRLSQITVAEVDRYKSMKVRERQRRDAAIKAANAEQIASVHRRRLREARAMPGLSPNSINKTLTRLGQILEVAFEYGHVESNAARIGGKRRRVRAVKPPQTYLDRAEQIIALLDAARELEAEARRHFKSGRSAFLAVLTFAGLRISEALALRVRDVDLAAGRLRVVDSKTPTGVRYVDLLPIVRDDLAAHKMTLEDTSPDALMFPTSTGKLQGKDNARNRIFAPAVRRANEKLVAAGQAPLPEGLTPHSLRRTCCSLRVAIYPDIAYIAEQLGHADTSTTHRIYTRVMRLDAASREALKRLVEGGEWAQIGANHTPPSCPSTSAKAHDRPEPAQLQEIRLMGTGGFEPPTSRV